MRKPVKASISSTRTRSSSTPRPCERPRHPGVLLSPTRSTASSPTRPGWGHTSAYEHPSFETFATTDRTQGAYPVVFIDCDSRRPGRQPPSSGCGPVAREARVPSTGSGFWLSSRRSGPRPSSFRCAGRQDRGQDRESTEARPYRADRKRGHQPVPRAHTRRSSGCGRTPGLSSSRSCSSTPRSAGSSARPTPWLFEVPRGRSGRLGFGAGEQFGRCGRGRGGAGWLRQGPGCGLCSSTGEPMTSHHGAGESTCPFRPIWTPSRARPV